MAGLSTALRIGKKSPGLKHRSSIRATELVTMNSPRVLLRHGSQGG